MRHQGIYRLRNTIIRKCLDINGGHLCQSILINIGKSFGQYNDLFEPQFNVVVQCCFNFDIILSKKNTIGPLAKLRSSLLINDVKFG